METFKLDITKTGIEVSAEMQAAAQRANALLESGEGYDRDKLIRFLTNWIPAAVNR